MQPKKRKKKEQEYHLALFLGRVETVASGRSGRRRWRRRPPATQRWQRHSSCEGRPPPIDAQRERGSKAHPLVGHARCRCRGGHAAGLYRPLVAAARIGGGAAPLGHRGGRMLGQEILVAQPGGAILPGLGNCLWPDPNWTGRHDRWRWIAWEPQHRGSSGRSRVATAATLALRGSTSVGGGASAAGAEGHVAEPRASGGARGAPSGVGVFWASLGDRRAHARARAKGPTTGPSIGGQAVESKAREKKEREARNTPQQPHPLSQHGTCRGGC